MRAPVLLSDGRVSLHLRASARVPVVAGQPGRLESRRTRLNFRASAHALRRPPNDLFDHY
jgi:hypothetical protein